ncbi:MAG TPA: hypothetical protein VGR73_12675 [Bryobacteraceae bacterium]|nr:hypothetical protein [Bryobacteraceae bacterium]
MSGSKSKAVVVVPARHAARLGWAALAVLCGMCAGCGSDFDETKVVVVAQKAPIHLDSEQVTLTEGQVNCGVDKNLFDPPVVLSERSVAPLRQAARDLGFSDDVSLNEPGYPLPYAQMRGDFMARVEHVVDIRDGPGQGVKTVQARVRVKVPHECFGGDLPIMGIRRGQFAENLPPTLIFQLDDRWRLDHFAH